MNCLERVSQMSSVPRTCSILSGQKLDTRHSSATEREDVKKTISKIPTVKLMRVKKGEMRSFLICWFVGLTKVETGMLQFV